MVGLNVIYLSLFLSCEFELIWINLILTNIIIFVSLFSSFDVVVLFFSFF